MEAPDVFYALGAVLSAVHESFMLPLTIPVSLRRNPIYILLYSFYT